MPRIARLDTPELLHYVMIRGIKGMAKCCIDRRSIFDDVTIS